MIKTKGYPVPEGYMGFVKGKYKLFESEDAYNEYLLEYEEVCRTDWY